MNHYEIAAALAREVFATGDELSSPARRLEYKGGVWPHNERPQGGLNESALTSVLAMKLRQLFPESGPASKSGAAHG